MSTPHFITINGKMFSGKDTLADGLAAALGPDTMRYGVSDLICVEARDGLEAMRENPTYRRHAIAAVAERMSVTPEQAQAFYDALLEDSQSPTFDVRDRTPGSRFVLQELGQAWRPPGYWANKAIGVGVRARSKGRPVVMASARWRAEHDLATTVRAFTVRLDVSSAAQDERSMARDGHLPSDQARNHPGETDCDGEAFDLRLNTDRLSPPQVLAAVLGALG